MTFGTNEKGEGTILLDAEETARFKQGQAIKRHSADAKGEFSITLQLRYDLPDHPELIRYGQLLEASGEATYQGWAITSARSFGYDLTYPGREDHFAETLNEALYYIDVQRASTATG